MNVDAEQVQDRWRNRVVVCNEEGEALLAASLNCNFELGVGFSEAMGIK